MLQRAELIPFIIKQMANTSCFHTDIAYGK